MINFVLNNFPPTLKEVKYVIKINNVSRISSSVQVAYQFYCYIIYIYFYIKSNVISILLNRTLCWA